MKHSLKPAWLEGTILSQQLFQCWDTYINNQYQWLLKSFWPFYWGVIQLVIDESALLIGKYRILTCQAIMENGIKIEFDHTRHGELCFDLKSDNQHEIYLAYSTSEAIEGILGYDEERENFGFSAVFEKIRDQYDSRQEREITFVQPKLTLLNQKENRQNYFALKIAKVCQKNDTQFDISENFLPSLMTIENSEFFRNLINRLKNLCQSKFNYFLKNSPEKHHWVIEKLQLIIYRLILFDQKAKSHPFELFRDLSEFLITLRFQMPLERSLPKYHHNQLWQTFTQLEADIKQSLEQITPTEKRFFKFNPLNHGILISESIDAQFFQYSSCYLFVKTDLFQTINMSDFLGQIKIAAPSKIQIFIDSALPSIQLIQQSNFDSKPDEKIFLLEKDHPAWEFIIQEQKLCLFVPETFNAYQYELMVH